MIRTSPFHERTNALNETGLWRHWSGTLAADRYQMSDKFEYFAVRNAAGVFDSSPLYKYRIHGRDAERFLSGVLARDIRACAPGNAQYTAWCDDRGFVVEDGVILRTAADEFLLTAAEPNLAYFEDLIGRDEVAIEEVSDDYGILAVQGPRSRDLLAALVPGVAAIPFFGLTTGKIAGAPVTVSRTGYSGDLGYEIWVRSRRMRSRSGTRSGRRSRASASCRSDSTRSRCSGSRPGCSCSTSTSRRAGSAGPTRTAPRSSSSAGAGWSATSPTTTARSSAGARSSARSPSKTSRWRLTGLIVDWADYDRIYGEAGLIPPKDHTPIQGEMFLYDDAATQVGYTTSFMYSPMLQRHIALARVRPALAPPGSLVRLEIDVNHRYEYVAARTARLPLYNPTRKTA